MITRLGIPCRWVYHASRGQQLEEVGLDPASIAQTVRAAIDQRDIGHRTDRAVKPAAAPVITTVTREQPLTAPGLSAP